MNVSRVLTRSTAFYDKLHAARGNDATAESAAVAAIALARVPHAETLLDVGCGTGLHLAAFAASGFEARGVEADLQKVALARSRVPHLVVDPADLTDFDLGVRFDVVVSLFGASATARVASRLDATLARIAAHLAVGGIAIVEPYRSFEAYRPGVVDGVFVDEPDLKIARVCVGKQMGKIAILDYHFLTASLTGVERFFERHELGLFGDAEYAHAFAGAGLTFERIDAPGDPSGRTLYVGRRRCDARA